MPTPTEVLPPSPHSAPHLAVHQAAHQTAVPLAHAALPRPLARTLPRALPVALRLGIKLARKLAALTLLLLLLSGATFALTLLAPGDAALNNLQPMGVTSHEVIAALRQKLGLDLPVAEQYLMWLSGVLTEGNLGLSSHFGRPVSTIMAEGLAVSLPLCTLAFAFLMLLTLPLGIYCALKPHGIIDRFSHGLSILVLSIPSFLLALLVLYLAGVKLGIITTLRPRTTTDLIAPALCLALPLVAFYLRQVRTVILSELRAPYLVALSARGISLTRQLTHHVLPRATTSLLPLLSLSIGHLLCGTVVIERIFSLHGLGFIALEAITYRDLYLIVAYVLYSVLIFTSLNAAVALCTKRFSRRTLSEVAHA